MKMTHFKGELFTKVRNLLRIRDENHSLLGLNDEDLLRALGFYRSDLEKGIEAYTLAAALLFGTDETIQNIAPHFKVDALVRIKDLDRYDDRLEIRTNLIEAYELLMEFIQKHLPDPFYEENGIRISLRSKIFREIVANILVHAEYSIPSFTRFIIYEDRVEAENPSRAFRSGPITLETLSPKPKNPLLAKLFIQIGRVEELGSGVRRTNQYVPIYASGETPQFIDGDIFKTIIPLKNNGGVNGGVRGGVSGGVKPEYTGVLKLIHSGKANKIKEISEALGISVRSTERLIRELKDRGLIYYDGSAKTGGYFLKELGLRSL
jgi:ATP-dependent DNA helicase RecG